MKQLFKLLFIFSLLVFVFSSCSSNENLVMLEVNSNANEIDYSKTWVKKESKNVDETFGTIRLRAKKNIGTFNISIVDDMGKTIPCFSTANEYITSSFYLKAGNKIIKLNEDSCVDSASRKIEKGMQILYSIENVADVFITFQCLESNPNSKLIDTVKITAHIVNTGKKKTEFQLKVIFDTVLGETDRHHFYDSKNQPVKNEIVYKKITNDDWFISRNANASMQFIFKGLKDTTEPAMVALANYATLDTKYWEPDMLNYRAFDTVLSYNNSAVGSIWKSKKIAAEDACDEVFYICTAYGNDFPQGEVLLGKVDANQIVQTEGEQKKEEELSKPVNQNIENQYNGGAVQTPVEYVDTTKDKYSKEYIQELIDKIQELSDSGEDVDGYEIRKLNEELDEILKTYRK